jgi:glycosyltransferase involved in cell wall biosynthesis
MSTPATTSSPGARISVLVCTRNRPHAIGACLRSILSSPLRDMELLVIDQSTDDATGEQVRALAADARLRYLRTPTKGLARARNIGIRESKAPLILFTDDDVIAEPTWVEAVLAEFDADPSIDAVYGRVLPWMQRDIAGKEGYHCPTLMEAKERYVVQGLTKSTHEALGHGNNMAFRRAVFARDGLYMEWLGAGTYMTGGEDTDFTFRILRRGAKMLYSPIPTVHHDNWMPLEKSNAQLYRYMFSASTVFSRFMFRGSWTAAQVQWRYLKQYWRDWRGSVKWKNWPAVAHHKKLTLGWFKGMLFGLGSVLRRAPAYSRQR